MFGLCKVHWRETTCSWTIHIRVTSLEQGVGFRQSCALPHCTLQISRWGHSIDNHVLKRTRQICAGSFLALNLQNAIYGNADRSLKTKVFIKQGFRTNLESLDHTKEAFMTRPESMECRRRELHARCYIYIKTFWHASAIRKNEFWQQLQQYSKTNLVMTCRSWWTRSISLVLLIHGKTVKTADVT